MQRCASPFLVSFGSKSHAPQEHLRAWLADSLGRDQYVTYRGDEVSILWHGRPSQCEVAFEDNVRIAPFGLFDLHSNVARRSKTCGQNYTSRGHHSVHTSPPSTDKASAYMAAPPSSSKLASSTPLSVSSTFRLASNTSLPGPMSPSSWRGTCHKALDFSLPRTRATILPSGTSRRATYCALSPPSTPRARTRGSKWRGLPSSGAQTTSIPRASHRDSKSVFTSCQAWACREGRV